MYRTIILPHLIRQSEGDAEIAHEIMLRWVKKYQTHSNLLWLISFLYSAKLYNKPVRLWDIDFNNWLGIAAGLDKNAEMLPLLQSLGPGHVEVGTITPRAQTGNPRPRVIRDVSQQAVINRLGFNGQGAAQVAANLNAVKPRIHIPIFGSLGMMKDTLPDEAPSHYCNVMDQIWDYVEVLVANISSPNTLGLRELQGGKYFEHFLREVMKGVNENATRRGTAKKPLLVKVAPDLSIPELLIVLEACEREGASGIIIGNTTVRRPLPRHTPAQKAFLNEVGGLSGRPAFEGMKKLVAEAARKTKLPIVAAGGIDSFVRAEEIRRITSGKWKDGIGQELHDKGVQLIQVHTGLYFQGPKLIREVKRAAFAA